MLPCCVKHPISPYFQSHVMYSTRQCVYSDVPISCALKAMSTTSRPCLWPLVVWCFMARAFMSLDERPFIYAGENKTVFQISWSVYNIFIGSNLSFRPHSLPLCWELLLFLITVQWRTCEIFCPFSSFYFGFTSAKQIYFIMMDMMLWVYETYIYT